MLRSAPHLRRSALPIRGPLENLVAIGPGSAEQRIGRCFASPRERCTAPGTRSNSRYTFRPVPASRRVDTPPHRPTLTLFRGEFRRGAERPQAQDPVLMQGLRDRGDPLNLIRVMPAKGQGCTRVYYLRGGTPPFP